MKRITKSTAFLSLLIFAVMIALTWAAKGEEKTESEVGRVWEPELPAPRAPSSPGKVHEQKSILSEISISAVGAYEQGEFAAGPSQWGAGIDLGLPINKFVSLHVRNLTFE